jgi:malonyl-CoA/methylmalonyl-CoA synthetase
MLDSVFKAPPRAQRFRVVVDAGGPEIGVDAVLALIEDAAAGLVAEGIAPGQRVLFCGEQGLPAFVVFWAAMAVGAVFVPVDPAWPEFMCRKAIGKIRPRLAVVEALDENRLWQRLAAELPTCTINPAGALLTQAARSPFQAAIIAFEAPAACLFTSGSTGDPKAVVLSRQALLSSAALVVQTFAWQAGERLLNLPDPHTMSGLRNALLAAPMAGMTWVCAPKPARANVFSLLGVLDSAQAQRVVAAPLLLRHINLLGDRVDKQV